MNPEVRALKEVVEKFGGMMTSLQQDYLRFKDWFDSMIESDEFLNRIETKAVNTVEKEYVKVTKSKAEISDMAASLDKLDELLGNLDVPE